MAQHIPEDLKMGREYALLGNYDTSLVYYEGAFQALKRKVGDLDAGLFARSLNFGGVRSSSRARLLDKHAPLRIAQDTSCSPEHGCRRPTRRAVAVRQLGSYSILVPKSRPAFRPRAPLARSRRSGTT